jgi:succinyl-CoA synthetase alpha subunit
MRILVPITKENIGMIKWALQEISRRKLNVTLRHVNLSQTVCPNMLIKDHEEVLFLVSPVSGRSALREDDTCLWTNNKIVVQTQKTLFDELWADATDVAARVDEVETGKPAEVVLLFNNATQADRNFREAMEKAEKEIVAMT